MLSDGSLNEGRSMVGTVGKLIDGMSNEGTSKVRMSPDSQLPTPQVTEEGDELLLLPLGIESEGNEGKLYAGRSSDGMESENFLPMPSKALIFPTLPSSGGS